MKRKLILLSIIIVCLFSMLSCEMKVPNPIVGAYRLPRTDNVTDQACLYLGPDGTFEYYQFANDVIWWSKGTYTLTLGAYNFLYASGDLVLRTTECAPNDETKSLLIKGVLSVKFSWECDKDFGPKRMNIYIADVELSDNGYRCEYLGSYSNMKTVLDEWGVQLATPEGVSQ